MREQKKIAAVILAAGYSSRMGELKPLLPMGEGTVIEAVLQTFFRAGICDVRVVVGHGADRLLPVLEKLPVKIVHNPCYEKGMFSSVQAGGKDLEESGAEAFFLLPADYPLIAEGTLMGLMELYDRNPVMVIYPCYEGQRGHPPLLSCRVIREILDYGGQGGLRELLGKYEEEALELPVEDEGILLDMDTWEDYLKCLAKYETGRYRDGS